MRILTFDDFASRVGQAYEALYQGGSIPVTLESAQPLPKSDRVGGSFRLVFRGPFEPILPQSIYPIRRGSDVSEIFIVPIGRTPAGTEYEALFL